jgi:hypothetical protein
MEEICRVLRRDWVLQLCVKGDPEGHDLQRWKHAGIDPCFETKKVHFYFSSWAIK